MNRALYQRLTELEIENRFTETLPGDPLVTNTRRQVKNACYSYVDPSPVSSPSLVACSREMMKELDLAQEVSHSDEFLQLFCGNNLLKNMRPYAMCYGGHQFGQWAGQLGDGRAILLGDVINRSGQRWSLQLKGAGLTPYSRRADGLAVLRSSLREYLCSEAMFHLGVPTTRALSLVLTGESIVRDMFYDGHPEYEPGAVVCRAAPSFTRFGNFQILTAQQDFVTLRKLTDYTIVTDFPELGKPGRDSYIEWFHKVCQLTADMVVHWMRVGFVHGVMNTDNMSILGLTIDYGPYGWLEDYDPDWTPNTTDANGRRYRFGTQAQIAHWNLLQLAEAIFPLVKDPKPLEQALQFYADYYQQQYNNMMANKLGFEENSPQVEKLNGELEKLLQKVETDVTLFYLGLSDIKLSETLDPGKSNLHAVFENTWYQPQQINRTYIRDLQNWLRVYKHCAVENGLDESQRIQRMQRTNPRYVLRNYLAQLAIDKVQQGDNSMLHELHEVLRNPYDEQPGMEQYAQKRPEWARHRAGCSMLSCSS
jgi:uncharacterized protein YdiU (UPF0061 family)